jgi:hypothetical protein
MQVHVVGPPIVLDAALFGRSTLVFTAPNASAPGAPMVDFWLNKQHRAAQANTDFPLTLHEGAFSNSTDMSEYLLRTWNDHDFDPRFGAIVFDDTILVNLTLSLGSLNGLSIGQVCTFVGLDNTIINALHSSLKRSAPPTPPVSQIFLLC